MAEVESKIRNPDWGPRGSAAATIAGRLSFEHVTHAFKDVEAVRDVSFELGEGEIVAVLGPSGCGKTTLLRIAAGLERQQSGRVLIDGAEVSGPDAFTPPEKRGVGLMFQDFALFPHLTILENVAFGLRELSASDARQAAMAALDRVGMSEFAESYPHVLSGGEQQRVALARAIVPRPGVLLMDEPFSGLDQRLRDSVRDETLAVLKETRASCLLVTHDPEEAMRFADRILLMRAGALVQAGTPEDLYLRPVDAGVARFFSDFNELSGVVEAGHVTTPVGRVKAHGMADGTAVDVLIRPQDITLRSSGAGQPAIVTAIRFLGDSSLVTFIPEDLDAPLTARCKSARLPEVGDEVIVSVKSDQVFVFAAGEDAGEAA